MSTQPNQNRKRSRAERLQGYSPIFPEVEQPAPPLVPEQLDQLQGPSVAIPVDYPRLRTILRDRDLAFKPILGQRDVAGILGKSDKTVRAWTRMGKLPCCWWPSGDPYYTPRNLEDFLDRCERGGKETR
ncbi:MAG: hypothetical protein ACLGRW_13445 [Acidobacteriota bacterium]